MNIKRKKIVLIFSLVFICSFLTALTLIDSYTFSETTDNIIKVYNYPKTNEIFKIFSNSLGPKILDHGPAVDMVTEVFEDGLIWDSGKKISFSKSERFLDYKNGMIFTTTSVWKTYKKDFISEIGSYSILQNSLLKSDNKIIIGNNDQKYILNNGNIIVTNLHEYYGTKVDIYSSDFELLESYNPFLVGFGNVQYVENENEILFVFHPTKSSREDMLKLLIVDSNTGSLKYEKEVYNNFSASAVFALKDLYVIYGDGWLNAVNRKGNVVWDKSFDIPEKIIECNDKKYFYILTMEHLFCMKKKNGRVKWKKDLSSIYPEKIEEKVDKYTDIALNTLDLEVLFAGEYIGIIIGQTSKSMYSSTHKYNGVLYILDKDGNAIDHVDCVKKSKLIELISDGDKIKIVSDNDVRVYNK